MRYLFLVALMSLGSTAAMADFQVFEESEIKGSKEFSCHFRGVKNGLRCRAWAEIHKGAKPVASLNENENDRTKLVVECNDGFELKDRHARTDWDEGTLKIKGRDNGDKATLKIYLKDRSDVMNESEEHFRARLEIEYDSVEVTLRGRCEKEENDNVDLM